MCLKTRIMSGVRKKLGLKPVIGVDSWLASRAHRAERRGELHKAVEYWRRLLSYGKSSGVLDDPELARIHFELGKLHTRLKNRIKSIYHLRASIRLHEDQPHYYEAFGRAFFSAGHWRIAKTQFQKATSLDPNNDQYWRQYALALFKLHQEGLAIRAAEKAVNLNPGEEKNHLLLAQFYAENFQWDKAREVLRAAGSEVKSVSMIKTCQEALNRKYRLSLEGSVLNFLRRRMVLDGEPFTIFHLRKAESYWKDFCRSDKRIERKRTNMKLMRIWAAALAYASLEKDEPEVLVRVSKDFDAKVHEVQAAAKLLFCRGTVEAISAAD